MVDFSTLQPKKKKPSLLGQSPVIEEGLSVSEEEASTPEPNYERLTNELMRRGTRVQSLLKREPSDEELAQETLKYQPNVPDDEDAVTLPGTMDAPVRNITNFLFGQDMAILGVKWDEEGFDWSMDKLTEQWTTEPLWSNLLTAGLMAASVYFPVVKAAKFGRLAKVGRFKYYDWTGLAGHNGEYLNWAQHIKTPADEINVLKTLKYLDADITKVSPSVLSRARQMAYKDSKKALRWNKISQLRRYDAEEAAIKEMMAKTGMPIEQAQIDTLMMKRGLSRPQISYMDQGIHAFEKRFGQQLWKISNDPSPQGQLRMGLRERLQKFYGDENFGDFDAYKALLTDNKTFATKFYQKMIHEMDPNVDVGALHSLDPNELKVYEVLKNSFLNHQKEWVDEGLAPTGVPMAHLIALTKEGAQQGYVPNLVEASSMFKALYSPTMLKKKPYSTTTEELAATWGRVKSGEIQVNNLDKLIQGYINDRMLLFNMKSLTDILRDPNRVQYFNDLAAVYKNPKFFPKDLVGLDSYFRDNKFPEGAEALRNMLKKQIADGRIDSHVLGPNDELPYMNSWIHEAVFGEDGFWDQSEHAALNILEAMTAAHKFAKTGLNPGSHAQNILGNTALLGLGGFNIFRPHNMKLMKDVTEVYKVVHDAQLDALRVFGTNAPNKEDVLIHVRRYLAQHGKDIKYKGQKITTGELADPLVQQLYMEGSFDSAEGYGMLHTALKNKNLDVPTKLFVKSMIGLSDNRFTRFSIGGKQILNEAAGKMETVGGLSVNRLFTEASKTYMGEDVIPKLALYIKNRAEGFSVNGAVREVAQRMPMYGLTGSWIKGGRKWLFPWASFPTEITRIVKNNLQDHPMRMLPWFKAASIAQSMLSAAGQGPATYEETKMAKRLLPFYGQTRDTVVTTGAAGEAAGAGVQSGLFGTALGASLGGVAGGVVGGVLGAAVGAGATYFAEDNDMENEIRGAVLSWLPHSSIYPKVDSPDYQYHSFDDLLHQIPSEPLAVFRGLVQILEGRDSFGNPISGEGFFDKVGKSTAQLIGFLAPPFIQKYGFQVTTPDVALSEMLLGKEIPGDITNVRRFLVDTGQSVDAITGRPGGLVLDLLLNNLGLWKSYRGTGETYLVNQRVSEDKMYGEIRGYHSRQLRFHVLNADDEQIGQILRRVFNTFSEQYRDNPGMAATQFQKWAKSQMTTLGEHPALRGQNKAELEALIELSTKKTGETKSLVLRKIIDAIKQERAMRDVQ